MKNVLYFGAIGVLVVSILIITGGTHLETDSTRQAPVLVPKLPDSLRFCGEAVPLQFFDVYESLERELIINSFLHSQTLIWLKKTGRYFPVIEPILAAHHIPDDFKYLAVAESGLSHVVSPAGARGFWQILEGTAKDYGLEVNEWVDERYQLEKATEAACRYLQDSYDTFQNWTLVAASYNAGRRGITRQIDRQSETNYYDLLLNEETARYVYRILAIKQIVESPEQYGFILSEADYYRPMNSHANTVTTTIENLSEYARKNQTSYKLLKLFNPWLRDNSLPNSHGKAYRILIPETRLLTNQADN